MGGTVTVNYDIYLENNTADNLNLVTITLDLAINTSNLTSFVNFNSDATMLPNTPVFDPVGGNFVFIIDDPITPVSNLIGGNPYDQLYNYDHIIVGPAFSPQVIAPGTQEQIVTVTMLLDGSQTFQDTNGAAADFIGHPDFINVYSGACVDPQPNVNNTFGFIDQFGLQLLGDCYVAYIQTPLIFLPVELQEFSGEAFKGYNKLYWITSSEENVSNFVVQRSEDPLREGFIDLGNVSAAGDSEQTLRYSFVDEDPLLQSFYRLKIIDNDGSIHYSDMIVLEQEADLGQVEMYPNPTSKHLNLNYDFSNFSDFSVRVIDVFGKVLKSQLYESHSDTEIAINVSDLASGIYFLEIVDGELSVVKQFMKSH